MEVHVFRTRQSAVCLGSDIRSNAWTELQDVNIGMAPRMMDVMTWSTFAVVVVDVCCRTNLVSCASSGGERHMKQIESLT